MGRGRAEGGAQGGAMGTVRAEHQWMDCGHRMFNIGSLLGTRVERQREGSTRLSEILNMVGLVVLGNEITWK